MDKIQTDVVQFSLLGIGTTTLVGKQAQAIKLILFVVGVYLLYKYITQNTVKINIG
ncbi:hypothetical protein ACWA1C_09085 [Flectobacillus roseus]